MRLNRMAGARRINSLGHKDMADIQDGLKCYSPKDGHDHLVRPEERA
nr:hypothetical protein [Bifidobacterium catenulatum]